MGEAWTNGLTQVSVDEPSPRENTQGVAAQVPNLRMDSLDAWPLPYTFYPWFAWTLFSGPRSSKTLGKPSWKQDILHPFQFLLPYLWTCCLRQRKHGVRWARHEGDPWGTVGRGWPWRALHMWARARGATRRAPLLVMAGLSGTAWEPHPGLWPNDLYRGLAVGLNLLLLTDVSRDDCGSPS